MPSGSQAVPGKSVCLTVGDPTGIGPEIAVKFLHALAENPPAALRHLFVIGDRKNLQATAAHLNLPLPQDEIFSYLEMQSESGDKPPGRICYDALETAVRKIHAGEAETLVTGPISKEHLHAAGLDFDGHTEILQHLAREFYGVPCQSDMLFLYRNFRMLLLTRHVPLRKVSETLTVENAVRSLDSLSVFLKKYCGIAQPRLCILGVNPHADELPGSVEEEAILIPACRIVSEKHGFPIEKPVAADAAFRHFDVNDLQYDAFVASYHDQGLIPFKMVAGYAAVNVTIGLPFLRTSVSHGTAPDIAGQGIADPASLAAAFDCAIALL